MITDGLAYMDDTDQEVVKEERMAKIDSKRRGQSVEENLRIFNGLLTGEKDCRVFCMRAKIDMQSLNGTMRDPVLYRGNDTPHHRTGTKYKAYPTYDFAWYVYIIQFLGAWRVWVLWFASSCPPL